MGRPKKEKNIIKELVEDTQNGASLQDNEIAQQAAKKVEILEDTRWKDDGGQEYAGIVVHIPVREEMGAPVLMEPLKDPVLIESIPVQEDVVEDESPRDIPSHPIVQPVISTKMPTRPAGEFVKLKDKVQPVVDMKSELVEKPAIQKMTLTVPTAAKSGPNYARRNIELIKDVNKVIAQTPKDIAGNPANRESRGVYKLSSNKRINNAGSTINTGAQFQNKQDN
jgi:hypothetical protein